MTNLSLDHLTSNATAEPPSYVATERSTDAASFDHALQRAGLPAERPTDPPSLPSQPADQPARQDGAGATARQSPVDSGQRSDSAPTEATSEAETGEAETRAQLPVNAEQPATNEDIPAEDEQEIFIAANLVADPVAIVAIKTAELLTLESPIAPHEAAPETCGADCTQHDVPKTTARSAGAAQAVGRTPQTAVPAITATQELKLPVAVHEASIPTDEVSQEPTDQQVDGAPELLEVESTPLVAGTDRPADEISPLAIPDTAALATPTNSPKQSSPINAGEPESHPRVAASAAPTSTLEASSVPQNLTAETIGSHVADFFLPTDGAATFDRGHDAEASRSAAAAAAPPATTGSTESQPAAVNTAAEHGIDVPAPLPKTFVDQLTARTASRAAGPPQVSEADRARFVQRVAGAFQAVEDGGGQVRLRLSPPELGALRLDVTLRAGVLSAHLEAETPQARTLLLDSLPALRDRLAEQNIRIERFEVELMNGSPGGQPHGFAQRDSSAQENGNRPRPRAAAETNTEAAAGGVSPRTLGGGQLNVVI